MDITANKKVANWEVTAKQNDLSVTAVHADKSKAIENATAEIANKLQLNHKTSLFRQG